MIAIDTEPIISAGFPVLPTLPEKQEYNNHSLTSLYRGVDRNYEIDCRYSPCRTKCIFHHTDLGFVIFHRQSERMIGSEKEISEHYHHYLQLAIKRWRSQFNDFDIR